MIKNIFSFETFFVLFLFSFQYKHSYPFSVIVCVELWLVAFLIPWGIFLYRNAAKSRFLTIEMTSFLLFSFWCLLSSLWVESNVYSISKAVCFWVYTVPSFLMAYHVIANNQQRLKRLLAVIVIFSFFVHLAAYSECILSHWKWVDVLGSNYLVTGQTLGGGFILLILFSFFKLKECQENLDLKNMQSCRLIFFSLILLCGSYVYIQLHLRGRGPVIGVMLILLTFYACGFRTEEFKIYRKHMFYIIFSCFFVYAFFDLIFETHTCHFLTRMANITGHNEMLSSEVVPDESIMLRLEYYKSAITAFLKHPILGLGLGGWAQFHDAHFHYAQNAADLRGVFWRHPHNIGLEVLAETGLVGGLLWVWFCTLVFKKNLFEQIFNSFLDAAPLFLLAFSLFNALKSGDLNDNILLFAIMGIVAAKDKHD